MQTSDDPASRHPKTIFTVASLFISVFGLWGVSVLEGESATNLIDGSNQAQQTMLYSARTPVTILSTQTGTVTETESIPFPTTIIDNPAWSFDQQEIQQRGNDGTVTKIFDIDFYFGEEVSRRLTTETRIEPTPEIILRGVQPKSIDSPSGPFAYRRALYVWATSYDGNCRGCSGITATGTSVKHGTCAVDPRVIPLGTRFYVPGYGICTAEDTGGAIKGNKIDLGFENVKFGWWSARWATIYIEE